MKIIIAGDFCPKYRIAELLERKEYSTIFGNFISHTKNSDLTIVNFETNISLPTSKRISKNGPCLTTNKNSVSALKYAGINAVTLANNHFYDYGQDAALNTLNELESQNIDYVGGGKDIYQAEKILYKEIDDERIAILNYCEHEFSIASKNHGGSNDIDVIKIALQIEEAKKKATKIIVITHSGHELFQLPSMRMKKLLHYIIDLGADLVVNHHQHCYSGKELYKGKYIYYGLGNFIFDYHIPNQPLVHEGFFLEYDTATNLINERPYIQCKEEEAAIKVLDENSAEYLNFFKNFQKLTNIISHEENLLQEIRKFYKKTERSYLSYFQPYPFRILKKLYIKGYLPNLLKKNDLLAIINLLECESHYDRVLHNLKDCASNL